MAIKTSLIIWAQIRAQKRERRKFTSPFFNQVDFKNCFAPYAKLLRLKKASQKLGIGRGHNWIEISMKNAPTLNLYDPMQVILFVFGNLISALGSNSYYFKDNLSNVLFDKKSSLRIKMCKKCFTTFSTNIVLPGMRFTNLYYHIFLYNESFS